MEDPKSSLKYIEVTDFLRRHLPIGSIVYVKGMDKALWLHQTVPHVDLYNAEDEGCPAIKDLRMLDVKFPRCDCHPRQRENAYLLQHWLSHKVNNQDAVMVNEEM